jgi:hypothetical protein
VEKVVYLLGAGFSAPLGLPLMKDFLIRSKDLYAQDSKKFASFKDILDTINQMHVAKSYYETDLFNIEEILSILEMEDMVKGGSRAELFSNYIKAVIEACTPPMDPHRLDKRPPSNYDESIFGPMQSVINHWGRFVASLIGMRFKTEKHETAGRPTTSVVCCKPELPDCDYSVITMNYDLIIENCIRHVDTHFEKESDCPKTLLENLRIAKLHGSVDSHLIAPTWKKWALAELEEQWKQAYSMLSQANYIRILGYSLPSSDSYVRYLLESAVLKSPNLKRIDVICLDDTSGSVRKRYDSFIKFNFYRYRNADIRDYIPQDPVLVDRVEHGSPPDVSIHASFGKLESWHEKFMNRP